MIISGSKTGSERRIRYRSWVLATILCLVLIAMMLLASADMKPKLDGPTRTISKADAEIVEDKLFVLDGFQVKGGPLQSDEQAHSGLYSLKSNGKAPFGLQYDIMNPQPGQNYRVSVWAYRTGEARGEIVASANDPKDFLTSEAIPIDKTADGWELLRLYFKVPELDLERIKVFTYCPGGTDSIYFDDFHLEEIRNELLPEKMQSFTPDLNIRIPTQGAEKLKEKQRLARKEGILITEDTDWVQASILEENDRIIPIEVRLKGDYLDHLTGNKQSLRVKVKGSETWNRMKTFSIQSPHTRSYMREWIFHLMLDEADVLSPRYDFVKVWIDSTQNGVYAIEEHFDKHLVESKKRREGAIIKMTEDGFWLGYKRQMDLYGDGFFGERMYNAFWKSEIRPFKEARLQADTALSKQYQIAQNLLFAHKYNTKPLRKIYDLDKLAAMYAIMDVNLAYHGKAWHNQRFYYNPMIAKLEPIAFDGFGERVVPESNPFLGYYFNHYKRGFYFWESPFTDRDFFRAYCKALQKYSDPDFLFQFFQNNESAIRERESLLKTENADYSFDKEDIILHARKIQNLIQPYNDISLQVRTGEKNGQFKSIELFNKHCVPVDAIGYGINDREMNGSFKEALFVPSQVKRVAPKSVVTEVPYYANFIFFKLPGGDSLFHSSIVDWPGFSESVPSDKLEPTEAGLISFMEFRGNEVHISAGKHLLDQDMIIADTSVLVVHAGATIDMINGSKIISYGPIHFLGEEDQAIRILSSDQTGQGLTVLQAEGQSQLYFVIFENMKSLSLENWNLTGAVNFYESNVRLYHCIIRENACEDALNIVRSTFDIDRISISETLSDGFDADFSQGRIINSTFHNTGNDGMDFSGSEITIESCNISEAGDKGISVGEESEVIVRNTKIMNSNLGVASKDLSVLTLEGVEITNCNQGLVAFQKKPEFGPARIVARNYKSSGIKRPWLIEKGSSLNLEGKEIDGKQ